MFTQPIPCKIYRDVDEERKCTDRICLILGLVLTLAIALYSILNINIRKISYYLENQNRLSVPSDSDGKMCGIDYPNFPYIYFTNPPDIV